jgi:peptidase S46-like protein
MNFASVRLLVLALLLLPLTLFAAEGKWTPQQVLELDRKWLAQQGLQLPPEKLWDAQKGTGLLAATLAIGNFGCSGGWISAEGLFITNHHCLFAVLQEHATPQNDIITNGFLARTRDAELRSKTLRVSIPRRFTDVTSAMNAAVPQGASDIDRFRALERKANEIVAECEKTPGSRCKVAQHDGGVQYVLQDMTEFSDVRLVYAPPRAVGEFGGEVDNWMWPRHTGDFSIARVYADGKPFRSELHFPLSPTSAKPDDFIMVLGYPGTTFRARTADEMEERVLWFRTRASVYREWIDLLEGAAKGNATAEIAIADEVKSLANRQKNGEGQLAGFRRGNLLEKQRASDNAVLAKNPAARAAYDGLAGLAKEKLDTFMKDFFLEHLRVSTTSLSPSGPKALIFPVTIVRSAIERAKPEADRDAIFTARNIGRVRESLEREQKRFFAPADKALLASFVKHSGITLPMTIDELYAQSKVFDVAERLKMFDESVEQLHARRDPLIEFAFTLDQSLRETIARKDRWEGAVARLRPEWRRAVIAHAGRPVAPDANSTLRVSFGHVKGYAPRDGLWATPQTTLAGLLEKHTGVEPFDVPESVRTAAKTAKPSLVVNFLADGDTTGGNSGSPVVNGRGELVGVNFDRVWENVANDFGYNPDVARNVSVDVGYVILMLRDVAKATELLKELGVK